MDSYAHLRLSTMVYIGYLIDPWRRNRLLSAATTSRTFMMVESTKQLNRGVLIGCVFLIVTVGAIYHVGALSNLFFLKTEGVVASEAVKEYGQDHPPIYQ